jgi:hypothetical protein
VSLGALNWDIALSSQQDPIYFSRPNAKNIDFHDLSIFMCDQLDEAVLSFSYLEGLQNIGT